MYHGKTDPEMKGFSLYSPFKILKNFTYLKKKKPMNFLFYNAPLKRSNALIFS